MAPVFATPLHSFYSSIAALVAKTITWLAAQAHNVRNAISWTGHLPSRVTSWITLAFSQILHWFGFVLSAIASFLVLLLQAVGAVLLALLILTALCHLTRQLWKNTKRHSQRNRFPPALYPSIHARQRILQPVVWPRYGTMDSILAGTTVSRVRVDEVRGLGWRRTIWQSVTLHAGGRKEHLAETECEAEQHRLDF
jgi:CBS domain containing-hemolysin-like protein